MGDRFSLDETSKRQNVKTLLKSSSGSASRRLANDRGCSFRNRSRNGLVERVGSGDSSAMNQAVYETRGVPFFNRRAEQGQPALARQNCDWSRLFELRILLCIFFCVILQVGDDCTGFRIRFGRFDSGLPNRTTTGFLKGNDSRLSGTGQVGLKFVSVSMLVKINTKCKLNYLRSSGLCRAFRVGNK